MSFASQNRFAAIGGQLRREKPSVSTVASRPPVSTNEQQPLSSPVVRSVPLSKPSGAEPAIGSDGRVANVDGMLAQVSEALVKQVSLDHEMQIRVGTAAGVAIGKTVLGGMFLGWLAGVVWNAIPPR